MTHFFALRICNKILFARKAYVVQNNDQTNQDNYLKLALLAHNQQIKRSNKKFR